MLGAIIGDIVGSRFEFNNAKTGNTGVHPGGGVGLSAARNEKLQWINFTTE